MKMLAKWGFWSVTVFCVWQVAVGQDPPSLQELVSVALNRTSGLAKGPEAAAAEAKHQLQLVAHALVLSGHNAVSTSQGLLNNAIRSLQNAIDSALGDLPRCVAGQQDAAARLVSGAVAGVVQCVTDVLAEMRALVVDVISLANKAVMLPHQAATDIANCMKHPIVAVFCVAEAVGRWGQVSMNITDSLTADARKAVQLLESGPREIATCAQDRVNTAIASINNIIVAIAQCVVDASNSTSTPNSLSTSTSTPSSLSTSTSTRRPVSTSTSTPSPVSTSTSTRRTSTPQSVTACPPSD